MDLAKFFEQVRSGLLGPVLSQDEVDGCSAILEAMAGAPLAHTAYALATAYKETWHTMQPIDESGGSAYFFRRYDPRGNNPKIAAELGNIHPGDGALFHGRGYVQLTGRNNYARAQRELGAPLLSNPALAKDPEIAAKIMRRGMGEGWFTGKTFASYLPPSGGASRPAYTQARRIINGLDCADEIAGYALAFEGYLKAAGY